MLCTASCSWDTNENTWAFVLGYAGVPLVTPDTICSIHTRSDQQRGRASEYGKRHSGERGAEAHRRGIPRLRFTSAIEPGGKCHFREPHKPRSVAGRVD